MKKIIIAIDGYSSCGKSSFAKSIASELGYVFIDTGAMYRAVTYHAITNGMVEGGIINTKLLTESLDSIDLCFEVNSLTSKSEICINGVSVEDKIRSMEVSDLVSAVSAIGSVRAFLVLKQQLIGRDKGVVMDGRDIGTVVFPDAELKIFMTASPRVRAERRYKELIGKGENVSFEDILKNIEQRDFIDTTREISPLKQAADAIVLDNSNMTIYQQMEWVMNIIKNIIK